MKVIGIVFRSVALLCYQLSRLFPRKRSQWVFGGATGFNNNSKYFFIDVVENHPEIKAYWIGDRKNTTLVRKLGYPAYYRFSLKGLWLCLTSKYYVVDHTQGCIDFWTSGGAKIINLWHGVGWKACLWNNPMHAAYKKKGWWANYVHKLHYPHLYYKPDLLLSSSPYMTEHFFAPMFELPHEKCIESEYPRCEFMLKPQEYILDHIHQMGASESEHLIGTIKKHKRTILYAPTYRDAQYNFIAESGLDFDDLNAFLEEHDYLFLLKCHPSTRINPNLQVNRSHVMMLDKYIDSYHIMPFADVLISDYSSIALDFMRLNRPLILFPFDKEQYNNGSRVFQIEYDELVEEVPQVRTYQELKGLLARIDELKPANYSKLWKPSKDLMQAILKV
ncbi:MAG: CDP-glycerol glycerophosphotransferase family protein [Prevotella sp.]|nr:CDP-glycerol glycerophosphotransferase family protein [Prevotella sp.]